MIIKILILLMEILINMIKKNSNNIIDHYVIIFMEFFIFVSLNINVLWEMKILSKANLMEHLH